MCHALKRPLKALGVTKVGHAGTLDPMATGLLVVCTGQATKSIEAYMGRDKAYTATLRLGQTTPSQDAETPASDDLRGWAHVTDAQLALLAAESLTGENVMQRPPIYSALHAGGGKRMYELAREGGEAAARAEASRPARAVRVVSFTVEPRPDRALLSAEREAELDAEQAAARVARAAAAAEAEASDAERRARRDERGGARTPSESSEEDGGGGGGGEGKQEEQEAGGEAGGGGADGEAAPAAAAAADDAAAAAAPPASGRSRRRDRAERQAPVPYDPRRDVRLACLVSKGTYVRTLGADLAELAGTGGHLTALRRTAVGDDLRVQEAWDVRELVARMREGLGAMGIEEAPFKEQRRQEGGGRGRRRGKGHGGGRGGGGKWGAAGGGGQDGAREGKRPRAAAEGGEV